MIVAESPVENYDQTLTHLGTQLEGLTNTAETTDDFNLAFYVCKFQMY